MPLSDLQGAARVAVALTLRVTDVVEAMQHNVVARPAVLGRLVRGTVGVVAHVAYAGVRAVTRITGTGLDAVLGALGQRLGSAADSRRRDAVVGPLNGVLGDHLAATANPLAIEMQWRLGEARLVPSHDEIARMLPNARARVVVMVHGLCMTDRMWAREGHDHGECLGRDLAADVLRLRYNTGLHVSTNGAALAALLEATFDAWPVPIEELVLVGHSMGGLVIRSACATAEQKGYAWLRRVRAIVFVGTPHTGARLERRGHAFEQLLGASPYTAALTGLGELRSAGITDMRHGSVLDADWKGRDRFARSGYRRHAQPLPHDIPAFAVAGTVSRRGAGRARVRGDGLVTVDSALGIDTDASMSLRIPPSRRWIAYETGHLDLLCSAGVYRQLRRWLAPLG